MSGMKSEITETTFAHELDLKVVLDEVDQMHTAFGLDPDSEENVYIKTLIGLAFLQDSEFESAAALERHFHRVDKKYSDILDEDQLVELKVFLGLYFLKKMFG